ncbi:choice-of-anchor D domain-containing protein [Flavobacterium sp.]|uniref:choice-of-anchor D domain-containing protein n=1 Tax=Flavobacterium sp. TaxID=239 RepID=UPI002FDB2EE4
MKIKIALLALLCTAASAVAQFSITAGATNYTQNFNTLVNTGTGTWSNNSTLSGWYAQTFNNSAITTCNANTGTTTAAALYSYGTNLNSDRSLGFSASNAFFGNTPSGEAYLGWRLRNDTGTDIVAVTVTFTGEQWRKENVTVSQKLTFQYQTGATMTSLSTGTWTDVPSLEFVSPTFDGVGASLDGNAAANRVANITATIVVTIPAGEEIMLRWTDKNDTGNDHHLTIDDVTVNATLSGSCFDPVNQASGITVTASTTTSLTFNWTNATLASGAVVVVRPLASAAVAPTDGVDYTGNAAYNLATDLGSNNRVVYRGTGNSVTVTGLAVGNPYVITVYAYNSPNCYNTVSPAALTRYTLASEPGAHPASGTCGMPMLNDVTINFPIRTSIANCTGYLILMRAGAAPTYTVTDATYYTPGTTNGTSTVVTYITNNDTSYNVTGLTPGTTYFFTLIPFGGSTVLIDNLNYRTSGTPLTFSCATVAVPEINITGGGTSIVSGATGINDPFGLNNTLFATIAIGASQTKDYVIANTGNAPLNLTGIAPYVALSGDHASDFAVTVVPSNLINGGTDTTFQITFSPSAPGVRTAIVTIANDDADEGTYEFRIKGTGACPTLSYTVSPLSGPVGTQVTLTAASPLTGSTVTFGGVPATTITAVSATQWVVTIPAGAITGNVALTTPSGCNYPSPFTLIDEVTNSCEGGNTVSNLFISQVTDATYGDLTYVEIYNGTGAAVNLTGYQVLFYNNGSATVSGTINLSGTLANNATHVVRTSVGLSCGVAGGDGTLANQTSAVSGINFFSGTDNTLGHDHIRLVQSGTLIDSWGVYLNQSWATSLNLDGRGVDFRRLNTATVPSPTFSFADWNIIDWPGSGSESCSSNDYSDIGVYSFLAGNPPVITQEPQITQSCIETVIDVTAEEGFVGGDGLVYQWFAVAPGGTTWTAISDSAIYSGTQSPILTVTNTTGLNGYQYYCQVRENDSLCYKASQAITLAEPLQTAWDGDNWTNGIPDANTVVVLTEDYNTATDGSFTACTVTVAQNKTLTISANQYVTIQYHLTTETGALVRVLDDGSLVMVENDGVVTNNGTMEMERQTTPFKRYDYVYWSSPLSNATLNPNFPGWRWDYAFQFATANFIDLLTINSSGTILANVPDTFDDYAPWAWQNITATTPLVPGKGYAVMASTSGTFPRTATVTFRGVGNANKFNNGEVPMTIALSGNDADANDDYNLVGNPYPSPVSADDFILRNLPLISGSLYFWTHNTEISTANPGAFVSNHTTNDYAMYNLTGGVATSYACANCPAGTGPNGFIASGQGFMVEAQQNGTVYFDNSMRGTGTYNNTNFYRTAPTVQNAPQAVKDRLWLNLTHENGFFSQQLIGYFENATNGIDLGYDGIHTSRTNAVHFYSLIDQLTYRIQGRAPFTTEDVVPLGYHTNVAGTFTIALHQTEGILSEVPVYLEDLTTGMVYNLKEAPVSFTTAVGTFNSRFVLKYVNQTLGLDNPSLWDSSVVFAVKDHQLSIRSSEEDIAQVAVYDMLGRIIYLEKSNNSRNFVSPVFDRTTQAVLVKVTLQNGVEVTRKLVL